MTRVAVVVEGSTEERFVKKTLCGHLLPMGVHVHPFLLGGRGGNVTVSRLSGDRWRFKASHDAVTSLVDFSGFRDKSERDVAELEDAILQSIRQGTTRRVDRRTVVPYVQKHEFEGLLFSDVAKFASVGLGEDAIRMLQGIRAQFRTPEEINDDKNTAPSKRILSVFPRYRKTLHGPRVIEQIGLPRIRAECPGFDQWVTCLESFPATLG